MNPAQLERLAEYLHKLRLFKIRERLEALLQQAASEEVAYADFLELVLASSVRKRPKHERGGEFSIPNWGKLGSP